METGDDRLPTRSVDRARDEYRARWAAVEALRARELASMTDARATEVIQSLAAVDVWRERADWSGLVEQQALFRRGHPG
jgi:hypothetical protein